MSRSDRKAAEARARTGYLVVNGLRFGGLGMVLLGIAIARGMFGLPWAVGAAIAVLGLLEFFFLPRIVARAWKAGDGAGDHGRR